ncbi:MAG: PD-(D/E)XK nuclease family protein [Rubrobacteraceae bacterium]
MVHAAEKLLDDFRALPGHVERPRTFMEIAGYPHYENVCSNILAFFMDPEESHRLETLVLDALASAGNIAAADEGVGGSVSVEREIVTDAGNRIDILIESDDRAILIENKIYASASNPFGDYAAYLDRRIPDGRAKHKLLLTVFPTDEGRKWDFTNLTYKEFVEQIRSLLGRYVSVADTRYLTMFLDFLNTLEHLQRGTRMDQEFVEFLAERSDEVQNLLAEVKGFKDELRSKVQDLGALITVEEYRNVEQRFWRTGTLLVDILYYEIRVSANLLVTIEADVVPHGWHILIWSRRGKGDRSELRDLLQDLEIQFEERPEDMKWFISPVHFDYDENLEEIRPVLQELIDKIATSQERE